MSRLKGRPCNTALLQPLERGCLQHTLKRRGHREKICKVYCFAFPMEYLFDSFPGSISWNNDVNIHGIEFMSARLMNE
jgi:hypothetical protein